MARLAAYRGAPGRYTLPDQEAEDDSTVKVSLWTEPDREPVALYTVYGGGHNAPHPQLKAPRLLGGTNRDFIAAEAIWAFFQTAWETQQTP